jgi:hypothetical protein
MIFAHVTERRLTSMDCVGTEPDSDRVRLQLAGPAHVRGVDHADITPVDVDLDLGAADGPTQGILDQIDADEFVAAIVVLFELELDYVGVALERVGDVISVTWMHAPTIQDRRRRLGVRSRMRNPTHPWGGSARTNSGRGLSTLSLPMASPTFDELLLTVDRVFQHPSSAQLGSVAITREDATDRLRELREGIVDVAFDFIGFGNEDAPDHPYLKLAVSAFGQRGEPLQRIGIDNPKVDHEHERRLIHRCLWWCVPRRLPLALLHERGRIESHVFDLPKTTALQVWDCRHPLCVPPDQLGVRARVDTLIAAGWQVELLADGVRLRVHEAPHVLHRVAQLFGQRSTATEGRTITVEANRGGLRVTMVDNREIVSDRLVPLATIGALSTVTETDSESAALTVFTNQGVETFDWGHWLAISKRPAMDALQLVLVSAMLGAP